MTRFIPFLTSFFFSLVVLQSQTYYIKFDDTCLDRYEFVTDIDKNPYVVYTNHLGVGQLTHLDIGKEQTKWVKSLPARLTDCNSISFNKAMALAINNSSVKMYIVRESPTHFNISPVEKATFIDRNDHSIGVTMEDADFELDWGKMYSNRNLGTPASVKEVYLEGTIRYQCETGYIFRKKDSPPSESFKEYTIIPSLGIINKRAAPNSSAITNSLKINSIDNELFTDFIAKRCKDVPFTKPVTFSEPFSKPDDVLVEKGGDIPTSYDYGPCPPPSRPGVHVVLKGETLYSISRRYGVSVDQIKSWNSIGKNNVINVCQELIVQQTPSPVPPTSGGSTSPTGSVTNKTIDQTKYHIVQPNETVSQLASMYGYTEDRFRQMNGLGTYERVYPGQKVFTSDCDCPNTEGVGADAPMPYETETARLTHRGNPDVYFRPIKVHQVKQGETLFAIALQYDTTVDRIRELNGLEKNAKLNKDQRVYVQ